MCARACHETLLLAVMYGSETMIWKERGVEMDKVRGLLGIRGME